MKKTISCRLLVIRKILPWKVSVSVLLKALLTTSLWISTTASSSASTTTTTTTTTCAWVVGSPLWIAPRSCRRRRLFCYQSLLSLSHRQQKHSLSLCQSSLPKLRLSSRSEDHDDNDNNTNNNHQDDNNSNKSNNKNDENVNMPSFETNVEQSLQQFVSSKNRNQSPPSPQRLESIRPEPNNPTTTTASFFPQGYVDLEDFVKQREREKQQQHDKAGTSNSNQIHSFTDNLPSKESFRFQEEKEDEEDDFDSIYLDADTYLATSMQMGTTLALDEEGTDNDNDDGTILMEEDGVNPWTFNQKNKKPPQRGTTSYHRRRQDMIQNLILQQIDGLEQYQKQQKQKQPTKQPQERQAGQSLTDDAEPTMEDLRALWSRQNDAATKDEKEKSPDRDPDKLETAEALHQQVFENEQGFLNQSKLFRESLTDPSKSAQAAVYRRQHFSEKENEGNALGKVESDDTRTCLYQKQTRALRELETQLKEFEDQFQKEKAEPQQQPRCDSCQCILSSDEIAAQKAMQRPEALCQVCHAEKYLITRQHREDEPSAARVRPQRFSSSFYYPTSSSSPPAKFPLKRSPTTFTPSATRETLSDSDKAARNGGIIRRTTVSSPYSSRSAPPSSRGSSSSSDAGSPSSPRSGPTKWRTSKAILNKRMDGKRRPAGTFIDTDHNGLNPMGPKSQSTKSRSPPTSLRRKEDDSSKKIDSETP